MSNPPTKKVLILRSTVAKGHGFADPGDVIEVSPTTARDLFIEGACSLNEQAIADRETELAKAKPARQKAAAKPDTEAAAK